MSEELPPSSVVPLPGSPAPPSRPAPARLRGLSSAPAADRLAYAKITFEVPRSVWTAEFTRSNPDVMLRIHSLTPGQGGHAFLDVEVVGSTPRDWTQNILRSPGVLSAAPLDAGDPPRRYKVVFRHSPLLDLMIKHEISPRYPAVVRHGFTTIEAIDRLSRIREVVSDLRAWGADVQLRALRMSAGHPGCCGLSPSQVALLHHALSVGYFDVPRRISLTSMAEKMGRSKSGLSVALAGIEKKILECVARQPNFHEREHVPGP